MKKKWIIVSVFLLGLLALIGAYDAYQYLTYGRYKEMMVEIQPHTYEFIENKQALVISWESTKTEKSTENKSDDSVPRGFGAAVYGKRYLSTESYQFIHPFHDPDFNLKDLSWGEFWKIQVYDVSTDQLTRKEYDLLEAIREYDDSYVPYSSYTAFFSYSNQEYRTINLEKVGGGSGRIVLFNLATGKIEDVPQGIDVPKDTRDTSIFRTSTSLEKYYEEPINNIFSSISLPNSVIKQSSDWRLKEEYPKAYELMTKQGGQLYLLSNETDFKLQSNIYNLLIPKDRQLFDNLTVYGSVTKDGQDHVVNSYEEFISVLKTDEEESNGN
ncbi:hypothetical protein [Streptococcus cristatus]|uniref:Uncharacterized protein n=1 Tax=Streptococcus cristatus TaxID=45634 RepID=A0A139N5M1_STRCR|nr:hypothetical protein [Streptococcus cristatus]KXT71338.1 hypothetical protein SCRDD08_00118 [Streptococcus cristatus]